MNQKSILFSALIIMSILVWTAGAIDLNGSLPDDGNISRNQTSSGDGTPSDTGNLSDTRNISDIGNLSDTGNPSVNEILPINGNLSGDGNLPDGPLDTVAPARVANLKAIDALGETQWSYTHDYPGLYVSWDANTEEDLAPAPYEAFISSSRPSSIKDMEKVEPTSDTSLYIEEYGGEPLVYGKDYWIAVIARDNEGNYDDCFAICGPVQAYEDMNIKLDAGWNMKSVPKRLVASNTCTESVFGKDSIVLYWNGECWEFPETIEPCKGYWVYSPEAFENNIRFKPMSSDSSAPDVPASLDLAQGWQMIGHTSTQPAAWSTTLASLKDLLIDYKFSNLATYSHHEGWGGIIPELGLIDVITGDGSAPSGGDFINNSDPWPVETLQYQGIMVPGQGYWIFMKKEGTYASIESVYNYQDYFESV
jgi:hypothetical protein